MNSGISRMIRERKDMLKGKNVILGVTGSIAAYKIASLTFFNNSEDRVSYSSDNPFL